MAARWASTVLPLIFRRRAISLVSRAWPMSVRHLELAIRELFDRRNRPRRGFAGKTVEEPRGNGVTHIDLARQNMTHRLQ